MRRFLAAFFVAGSVCAVDFAQARTLEQIKALGTLSLCANDDALPYASRNGPQSGFQVEIAQAIAADLGVNLSIEWILPARRANVVKCDLLMDRQYRPGGDNPRIALTKPYSVSRIVLGTKAGAGAPDRFESLDGTWKIGVLINSVASITLGKARKSTSPYAFQSEMFKDLIEDRIRGIAVSEQALSYEIVTNPRAALEMSNAFAQHPDLQWPVSAALREADPALLEAVNAALARLLETGAISAIYAKYGIAHIGPKD